MLGKVILLFRRLMNHERKEIIEEYKRVSRTNPAISINPFLSA